METHQDEGELEAKMKELKERENELQESYSRWKESTKVFGSHLEIYHSSLNKSIFVHGECYKILVWTEEWLENVTKCSQEKQLFMNKFLSIIQNME